ncbi:MAG: UDP-N-acetylmuramoyl-L-alanyl-D-glutamate--2,6-diaminopimelate ligase [Lentisphaerae bacterium]|nr:UDP-N-acetylmuramoyl-L-alanyl-D-glutamate--2,6-diaminopimelate ligase [Lentisphaerota bacterium]
MPPSRLPLRTLIEALGEQFLALSGPADVVVDGACADSRQVQPGWLFCAIPGAREDGAAYADDAVRRGAVAVATTRPLTLPAGVAQVMVRAAYPAAGRIAEGVAGWPARSLRLLGITGTNGKTTCAYLLRDILRAWGRTTGMVGTVCYDLGRRQLEADRTTPTPFALQDLFDGMRQDGAEWAVLEMSSRALDQRRAGTARFRGAAFTNLTGDHLDYHRTMEAYFEAKALLFEEYLQDGAPAVIMVDDPYGRRLAARLRQAGRARVVGVGSRDAEVVWQDVELGFQGCRFTLRLGADEIAIASPLIGMHNVANLTCAAALAHACGVPAGVIAAALRQCPGAPGRLQGVTSSRGVAAYVDYAHTDDALENVLRAVRTLSPRRVLLVFGCGGDRDRTKRPRMGAVAARLADRVFVTSDNPRSEDPERILADILAGLPADAAPVVLADRREAIRAALAEARSGDLVLIAGKGHEPYQEIQGVKHPFSDLDEVRLAMAEAEA